MMAILTFSHTALQGVMAAHEPLVLLLAAWLDYLIGDPWNWWHPVQGMGWIISQYTQVVGKRLRSPLALKLAGIGLAVGLIVGSGLIAWTIATLAKQIHPLLELAVESILLASCLAGRSLRDAANDVLTPLQSGDLVEARTRLSRYVGRDTEKLAEPEILRAVLETVTENATDGVLAPLFYAIVGSFIPGVGSVPLAIAYKAASTLDSMVGYREAPYTDLGWFSAKTDDVLTWLPCRLVVVTLALLSGKPVSVWRICQRDAPQDPSPNSGWSECVYAAVLGVQVGGLNYYRGVAKPKPLLGDAREAIAPSHIHQALNLTRICFLLWLAVALVSI
ncbi:adenosylcobinamide-phosphate synthase CbiB [Leptodesmis sp.]|uniref:adenosylcobinamide-phosphate synthase CbiB n=1 Tax=Leptodesmis sp. TaxID=3100501 RepID=UPI0040534C4D